MQLEPESISDQSPEDDIPWQSLNPNSLVAARLGDGIAIVVIAAFLFFGWGVLSFFVLSLFDLWSIALGLLALFLCSGWGYFTWQYSQWNFDATRWREVHRGFEIRQGVFWRHHIFVPRERIQHTDVVRGPIMRHFGLAHLVIHTAGTHNHQISLFGLGSEQAERLRQSLLPQQSNRPVQPLDGTEMKSSHTSTEEERAPDAPQAASAVVVPEVDCSTLPLDVEASS